MLASFPVSTSSARAGAGAGAGTSTGANAGRIDHPRSNMEAPARPTSFIRSRSQSARRRSLVGARGSGAVGGTRAGGAPILGGMFFSDLVVVAFFFALNLVRTCGIAELADVAWAGVTYFLTRLPFDFYQRWTLSQVWPFASSQPRTKSADVKAEADSRLAPRASAPFASSAKPDPLDEFPAQLSPFHHLVILLTRFACSNFPHLLPRVLFAEETIGPLVRWRTGGGAAELVREFAGAQVENAKEGEGAGPGFRAFWIGADARTPQEVRRATPDSRRASTLLYLHGGGFSLGSVAFYAEALMRILAKINTLERAGTPAEARVVAVEYDLAPTARFPEPLLQCLRCYAHLVEVEHIDPNAITIAGDSAGANLAMGLLLCLSGQARGDPRFAEREWSCLPMPGKALLLSPWADLRPSKAHAFAAIRASLGEQERNRAARSNRSGRSSRGLKGSSRGKQKETSNDVQRGAATRATEAGLKGARPSDYTEAVAYNEWDFVAAESLLHYAQIYAGVLRIPRRVRGPFGWIAQICAIIATSEENDGKAGPLYERCKREISRVSSPPSPWKTGIQQGKAPVSGRGKAATFMDPPRAVAALGQPPRHLARALHEALMEPLPILGRRPVTSDTSTSATADGGLDPLFPPHERRTTTVRSRSELYETFAPSESDDSRGRSGASGSSVAIRAENKNAEPMGRAQQDLETNMLLNPATGDWSRIRLAGGALVMWGERELLADDIEEWVTRVRAGPAPPTPSMDNNSDSPSQDGASPGWLPRERFGEDQEKVGHAKGSDWLFTAVEHGPGGVHAWPFVSMYLAGTEAEREKGLEAIARFVAVPPATPPMVGTRGSHAFGWSSSHGQEHEHLPPHPAPRTPPGQAMEQESDNELGLSGVPQPSSPQPSSSTGDSSTDDSEDRSHGRPRSDSGVGLGLGLRLGLPDPLAVEGDRASPHLSIYEDIDASSGVSADVGHGNNDDEEEGEEEGAQDETLLATPRGAPHNVERQIPRPWAAEQWARSQAEMQTRVAARKATSGDAEVKHARQEGEEDEEDEEDEEYAGPDSPPDSTDWRNPAQRATAHAAPDPRANLMDPSHYSLSYYSLYRPEPEGLSDITEEGSNLSAIGAMDDSAELSPPPPLRTAQHLHAHAHAQTSAPTMDRRGSDSGGYAKAQSAAVQEWDTEQSTEQSVRVLESEGEGEDAIGLFSPPAGAQPGPDLPLVPRLGEAWRGTAESRGPELEQSSGGGTAALAQGGNEAGHPDEQRGEAPRKKPKGDVWW